MQPYRYLAEPQCTKKGKVTVALGFRRAGMSDGDARAASGTTGPAITRAVESYEKGRGKDPAKWIDKALSMDDTCELYGACASLL
eukprot:TRINITY_DN2719_c0_g1_i2.p3 TRINITY_DN2719_c0_g1~~TRINITY_DN2719_c0_g1_i2.p3  ORF type:complete len:100 (-),score=46.65 TRINITY_DN2719_c0_g1_i2:102-356(-)